MTGPDDLPPREVYTAAQREQLVRWATIDRLPDRLMSGTRSVVRAARQGTVDQLRDRLAALTGNRNTTTATRARHLLAGLDGDLPSLASALEHSAPLLTLAKTIAQRAGGLDIAEIAIQDGTHLIASAIETGRRYEITLAADNAASQRPRTAMTDGRIWNFDADARPAVLGRYALETGSAINALHHALDYERASAGITNDQLHQLATQVHRLRHLDARRDPTDPLRPPAAVFGEDPQRNRDLFVYAEPEWIPLLERCEAGDAITREALARSAPNLLAEYNDTRPGTAREHARANLTDWVSASYLAHAHPNDAVANSRAELAAQLERDARHRRETAAAPSGSATALTAQTAQAAISGAPSPPSETPSAATTDVLDAVTSGADDAPGWHNLATSILGVHALHGAAWQLLADTLDRAAHAGWNPTTKLARLAAQAPLGDHACAELTYRVIDACPAAHPPPPTVAAINGEHATHPNTSATTTPPAASEPTPHTGPSR